MDKENDEYNQTLLKDITNRLWGNQEHPYYNTYTDKL